jgi:anti-anti-sigma factor
LGRAMVICSRTPEGWPHRCPVCGFDLDIEPADPPGDAPCSRCGHLLWFTWKDLEDVQVFKPTSKLLHAESLDSLAESVLMRPGMRLVLDLSEVQYLSSPTLSKLIDFKKKVAVAKGKVSLRHLHPDLLEVFRLTRLHQVFDIEE